MKKLVVIIIALLWATAAGAACWDFEGHEICDMAPPYPEWTLSKYPEPQIKWMNDGVADEGWKTFFIFGGERYELGLREDGVVVWRKVRDLREPKTTE